MKKQTLRRFSKISCILLAGLLLCSCSTPVEVVEPIEQVSVEQQEVSVESQAACVDTTVDPQAYEVIRKEKHDKLHSTPETEIMPLTTASSDIEVVAVITKPTSKPTKAPVAVTPLPTATAKPTASPTATPLPKVNESESTATPKLTSPPTATPTAQPTVLPTEKPLPTATPVPTIAPTATPSSTVTLTPTPIPAAVSKIEEVWIVDVPGHYETMEDVTEVWVDEQGHWEESGYWTSDWVYQCNQCGAQYPTVEAVNRYLDDSFDWDTLTGHSSYAEVSGPMYWVEAEPEWVVDVPGHYETVTESKEVWIDEQGHWETVTT